MIIIILIITIAMMQNLSVFSMALVDAISKKYRHIFLKKMYFKSKFTRIFDDTHRFY